MTTERPVTEGLRKAAHELASLGYHLVPLAYGTKRPLVAWKDSPSGHKVIEEWLRRFGSINPAVHAGRSGVVVLDADTPAAAAWVCGHCPRTPMTAATPRGGRHFYFRAPADAPAPAVGLFGIGLDVRSRGSLIAASPSYSQEHGTRWRWEGAVLPPSALPVLPAALIRREPVREPTSVPVPRRGRSGAATVRDVTRWVMAVESVQGSGGSNQCFKVACRLVDAGLPWGEAWRHLCRWNAGGRAIPPWSEAELRHKLRDAFAR